jgi:hypothetical protein
LTSPCANSISFCIACIRTFVFDRHQLIAELGQAALLYRDVLFECPADALVLASRSFAAAPRWRAASRRASKAFGVRLFRETALSLAGGGVEPLQGDQSVRDRDSSK